MPRRARLSYKKNWERKRQARKAQMKHAELPTMELEPSAMKSAVTSCTLEDLHKSVKLPNSWSDQSPQPLTCIRLCKVTSPQVSSSKQPLVITHCLTVSSSFEWSLFVHNHEVQQDMCPALKSTPAKLNSDTLSSLLSLVDRLGVCAGQPDNHFIAMVTAKKGVLKSRDGLVVASLDDYAPVTLNGESLGQTVRTSKCEVLVNGVKCQSCKTYRDTLRTTYNRWSRRRSDEMSDTTSHANNRYLNTPEKRAKLCKMKKRVQSAELEVRSLQQKIEQLTRKYGESVDSNLHGDLLGIMAEKTAEVEQAYPEGSFSRLFWEEQLRAASAKDPRQVRWHPLIIRWCLNLKLMSSAAYHATRSAGFIKLPSERTLRDYTHYFNSQPGFQQEVNQQLHKEANVAKLPETQKFCALVLDEMKIKENLVYNKFTGEIVGYVNLGNINDELLSLERRCQNDCERPDVAKQLLVLMVRGIFFKLDFPLAHFATTGVTADLLFPICWEGVRQVECVGLKVICITADGASPNRKFFRMHGKGESGRPLYKTRNPYAKSERWIYFVSDPPHLLKTVRNCWSHSGWNGTRHMVRNGEFIEWKHLQDLYEKLSEMALQSQGVSLLPKLKSEHVNLTSYARMRVDLAAQVLSTSVANCLAYFGQPGTKETEYFIRQFDRWFDCLNVRSLSEWAKKKKPDLKPYTSPSDSRLDWLENDFLKYLDDWERTAKANPKCKKSESNKMLLSGETIEGLRITVRSFVEMTRFLLSQPGGEGLFFLSERISQDPLENYFGKQRARGGRCDNPNFKECLQNAVAIRAQRSLELDRVQGNCRRKRRLPDSSHPEIDDTPLPKRKRKLDKPVSKRKRKRKRSN